MRRALILFFTFIATHAMAFDPAKAPRYPSPDMNTPNVNRLFLNGTGDVQCLNPAGCDASAIGVKPPGGNTIVSLSQIFGDWLPGRAFGMKCNGIADDTNALSNAASSGKRVLFPPGVCITTASITMTSGTKWNALVPRGTEIRATAAVSGQMIGGNNVSDVEVTGFVLNTQKAAFPGNQSTVLYFNNSFGGPASGARINVSNNYVPGSSSGGLAVDNTTDVALNDNEVVDTYRDAIRCASCTTVQVLRNKIHDHPNIANGFRAIIVGSSRDVVANDNIIARLRQSDGGEGVFAFDFGGTKRFTIASNQIQDVESFLDFEQGTSNGNVANNTFIGKITSLSMLNGTAKGLYCINNGCSHISFIGNEVSGVYNPIDLEGGYDYTILANRLHDFYGAGILASPVDTGTPYANPDRPNNAQVDMIVAMGNTIINGGLAQPGSQSGINVRAITGVVVANIVNGSSFAWDILDFNTNTNVEMSHNVLAGNGQSPDKNNGISNHRGRREHIGNGSPLGVVTGSPGDTYFNRQGGAGTTYCVKESGNDASGWVCK